MTADKVLRWCRSQNLFPGGGPVTAALSGGADSAAMLRILLELSGVLGITVTAAHFNHHLRGAASDRDEDFCRGLCEKLGVPLRVGGADVAALARARGQGVETAAREARYAFLLEGEGTVATAHNADDNLETVLLHLTRGAALRGLGGIPPKRDRIVRPVLCLTRTEILDYLREMGLSHVEDETNETDLCPRNRLRRQVMPRLREENPAVAQAALAASLSLREDEAYLSGLARDALKGARREGGWSASALAALPRPVRLRALRALLEEHGGRDVALRHLEAAEALLTAGPSAEAQLPGLTLRRQYDLLRTGQAPALTFEPFLLPVGGSCPLPGGSVLRCSEPFPYGGETGLCLTAGAPVTVRPRKPGDRLRLRGGTKPVKEWMIDRKIPAAARDGVPVLERNGTVAAVWGVGVDPEFAPRPGQLCCRVEVVRKTDETNREI